MRRTLIAGLAGTLAGLGSVGLASAAGLGLSTAGLMEGSALAGSCDRDGVDTAFTTAFDAGRGYTITHVVVSAIDFPLCGGMRLQVTLTDGDNQLLGEGGIRITDSSMVVPILPAVPASSVHRVDAFIAG